MINHYQFYGKDTHLPIPWPNLRDDQSLGIFHYESKAEYAFATSNSEIMDHFDFSITPQKDADIPITIVCDWGYSLSNFLMKPKQKQQKLIADFRGIIPPTYNEYFKVLSTLLDIDFFDGPYKNSNAPEPYYLEGRISQMGEYKFIIIAERIFEDNW